MKSNNKKKLKVVVPLSMVLAATSANSLAPINAITKTPQSKIMTLEQGENLLLNPGFEDGTNNWEFIGGGLASNNQYKGTHFYLNGGSQNKIKQTVKVPKSGNYTVSAWLSLGGSNGKISVVDKTTGSIIGETTVIGSSAYSQYILNQVYLEQNQEVEVVISGCSGWLNGDEISMFYDETEYRDINAVEFYDQSGKVEIDKVNKTINFAVRYGTDINQIKLKSLNLSRGATLNYKLEEPIDFSKPVVFKVSSATLTDEWTVKCIVREQQSKVTSSNKELEEGFNWAIDKTNQFVMTGKNGVVNKDEYRPSGDGTGIRDYIPSYWAGYYDRTAFYGRDFVHQATGGYISGHEEENLSMFEVFAKNATEARKWYTLWAFNFDGSPHTIDYKDDNNFVREVPAQFELVEKAYEQYLWTGDSRYIEDEDLWNFYTNVMTNFVTLHDDQNPNGIAEGYGGIFQGSCTYNERGEYPIEAGDAIASQYQATLAYAGMLEAKGKKEDAKEWYKKADDLKKYFNEEWSVINENNKNERYARIIDKDGNKKNDFGKENSWFMPMKLITEPGERNDNYLDYISEKLGDGIGTAKEAPTNIEAYTYIPDTYFPYNRNDEAWKWMKYILSVKDNDHERPSQGTNGDYPEISFTIVDQTVEGMMGIEANAPENSVVTAPRLPGEVEWVKIDDLKMGEHNLSIEHNGLEKTILKNSSEKALEWEARFYGDYDYFVIGNEEVKAEKKEVNGVLVSYVKAKVNSGETLEIKVKNVTTEELRNLVEEASLLNKKDYTKDTWKTFEDALKNAQKVLSKDKSTQLEINKAFFDLKVAKENLNK
ncbi:hypothetical protein [Romboutsia sp.]|uniref:hypothetical protein n=1 Tax=Romboutsia sp. TaxID=1965302 RepID=UPI003F3F4675